MADAWDQFPDAAPSGAQSAQTDAWAAFPDAAPVAPSRVPHYDPMDIAIKSLNASEYAKAQAMPGLAPQAPRDIGQQLHQSQIDTTAAHKQHAASMVRDRAGNFVRKPLGEMDEGAEYPVYRSAAGQPTGFNPATDVMLRDPQTGKLMAFERSEELDGGRQRAGGAASKLLEGFAVGPVSRIASGNAVPMAVQRGAALGFPVPTQTYQLGERARDAAAMTEIGAPVFAPAFRSKGAARLARTVEEMPGLGGIVKGPKTETEMALANAQSRIASQLGAASTDEQAGLVLQGGLDRFKTARINELEPGVVAGAGAAPWERAQRPVFTLSEKESKLAPAADAAAESAGGRGVPETMRGAAASVSPIKEVTRRSSSDMSVAELQAIAKQPAGKTSFAARQEALYELADRKIPDFFKIDGAANAGLIATPQSGALIKGLLKAEESMHLQGGVAGSGRYSALSQALKNAQTNFTIDSLKRVRTEVGRALGDFVPYETNWTREQLNALYTTTTKDLQSGYQTLANRAWRQTAVSSNRLDYITPEVARAADRALYEFKRADRYTRIGIERMDRFTQLLNAKSPEAAMRGLSTRMKEGTLDRGLVRAVTDALRPEERSQVLGYLVARMGQRPGSKEAERVWNIESFATDWNKNKAALALMTRGTDPSIRRNLDLLASRAAERMKYYETTRNYSGTAYTALPFTGLAGAVMSGGVGGFIGGAIVQIGGMAALGKFLTSPRYLDWMVKAAQTGAIPRAAGPQIGGTQAPATIERSLAALRQLAANDNELGPVVTQALELLQKRAAKGEDERPDDQGQHRQPQ